MPLQIDIPHDEIAAFCRRWRVKELSIFGSALRDDFRPDSDEVMCKHLIPPLPPGEDD